MNSDAYEKKIATCPLCGASGTGLLYSINRYSPGFSVDRCPRCGFIFMNPRFKHYLIVDMYGEHYYAGKAQYSYYDERKSEKYARHVWDRRIRVIRRYVRNGNLLDIGSSFGGFLKRASLFFKPFGIEISTYAGNHARSLLGESIHIGTIDDHPFAEKSFSVITMIELLEHLPDPSSALRECFRLLMHGGLLVVQTANMDGLQARLLKDKYAYFMPGHLSYFTRKNLSRLLLDSGFSRIKTFFPVEFGLLPKLRKSRYTFSSWTDYFKMIRIVAYHLISKIHFRNIAMTSSMVIYAFKD